MEIAFLLGIRDLGSLVCVSWTYHNAATPFLYRHVSVNINDHLTFEDQARTRFPPHHILTCLVQSLSELTSHGPRCNPQYIRTLSFGSFSTMTDYQALPLLAEALRFAHGLKAIRLHVGDVSLPVAVDVLQRHGHFITPMSSFLSYVHRPAEPASPTLGALEFVRATRPEIAVALMQERYVKTLVLEFPMMEEGLDLLLFSDSGIRGTSLTKLSLGTVSEIPWAYIKSLFTAISAAFPNLEHVAFKTSGNVVRRFTQVRYRAVTDYIGVLIEIFVGFSGYLTGRCVAVQSPRDRRCQSKRNIPAICSADTENGRHYPRSHAGSDSASCRCPGQRQVREDESY